ncbi:CCR4-NOT transcription complex subunit 9-like isoform X1 [Brassica napus]|uniref:CCR4-NOT transcription complex subunit 9-like isoform X1 n=1 Tax=Brassica napus TaxID=3708 RepID=UPI00207A8BCB|nr:CCR4-NOT transcription complex subunit 9-like isoform X1 [Brassica napus]
MANLPDSLYEDYSTSKLTLPSASSFAPTTTVVPFPDMDTIIQWINDLHNEIPFVSNSALQNLVTHRNTYEILPLLLWKSPCTMTMMLQEIVKIYPHISAPVHSQEGKPPRAYNILLLFQCVAHYPETRGYFLKAEMPHYLFPLMDIDLTYKPLECLRLGALGVLAHMLKAVHTHYIVSSFTAYIFVTKRLNIILNISLVLQPIDGAAVRFLMDNGALRYCTKAIEIGSTESKTVSVFILNKILSTNEGLQYCCVLADRFFLIDGLLKKLLVYLSSMTNPSPSLFNLIAGCYAKLSQKPRAREGLWRYPPVMLLNGTFASLLAVRLKHFVELCMVLVDAVIVKTLSVFVCVFLRRRTQTLLTTVSS